MERFFRAAMKELTVRTNDAGQRLDRFVGKAVPLLPESLLQKYIRLKRIKLNGKGAKRDTRLNAGDVLQLYINDEFFEKPREENSFAPALCNRIDRNTGGIVIAAKNVEALRILNDKIRDREIEKYYLCAVHGRPKPASGRLENLLFKDAGKNQVFIKNRPEPGAKTAVTEYRVLCAKGPLSLVECHLLTGRTHQIRAQMAHAGWPLLGDGKYGSERFNRDFGEKGQALYSYKLRFSFPTDAGILEYLRGREFTVKRVDFAEKYFGIESLGSL